MKAQDYKDIKIDNADTVKVMSSREVWWQKNTVPGPSNLIGGNLQAGFYGEVPTSDFITGDELAKRIGLSAGVSQFSNEPWLKFSYLGNTEFVAKKPFRYFVSWNNINAVNAVFGNRIIEIDGMKYKVRLIKGKTEGKQNDSSAYWGTMLHGSEWNKLMMPIHQKAPSNWKNKDNVNSPTENWNVGYTDNDLLTEIDAGNGSYSWCQEYGNSTDNNLLRGYNGVSYSGSLNPPDRQNRCGWRPVLEIV